jgi:hypothetical protein
LVIYGPEDFRAACGDTPDEHAERVVQVLGAAPAKTLQALIDGTASPELPPRVPRIIQNWRAKAVLAQMGLTERVAQLIAALPPDQSSVVEIAWSSGAELSRTGATVTMLGAALGMSAADLDQLFIAAEAIEL